MYDYNINQLKEGEKMNNNFNHKSELSISEYVINLINNNVDLSDKANNNLKQYLEENEEIIYGKKIIRPSDIVKCLPYDEHDFEKIHIDLKQKDVETDRDKNLVISISENNNLFIVRVNDPIMRRSLMLFASKEDVTVLPSYNEEYSNSSSRKRV